MKKSNGTILSCLAFLLFLSPTLNAQQDSQNNDNIIIKKEIREDGAIKTDKETLEKGEKFKVYLDKLNLENSDAKDVKIEVFTSEDGALQAEDNGNEETIFFYRSADSDETDHQDIEKLVITLNDVLEETQKEKKPLLGVYSKESDDGVLITGIVVNSGAQAAGLQKGDLITALNDQTVNSTKALTEIIAQYKVGDAILVSFQRDGANTEVTAILGAKKERRHHFNRSHFKYKMLYGDQADRYYNSFQDRNPCKAFIGVYTSNHSKGLIVHSLIANTPAEKSNVMVHDVILAIDDVEVSSHEELIIQRDKHQAGDYFTLSILRDGQAIEIEAQFDPCPTDKIEEPILDEETLDQNISPPSENIDNTLELESIRVFPNPTYGPINLNFKGQAGPTTIRLTDSSGKVIYEETLNNFDGEYSGVLNYRSAATGTLFLTVQQGQKIYSESLILLPKA